MSPAILLYCVLSLSLWGRPADFWETPSAWGKLREGRKILVSATHEDGRTHSKGAGLVAAPVDKVWAFATNPEKIRTTSRLLKAFHWDQRTGDVDVRIEFLAFTHRVRGRATKFADADNPRVEFEVHEASLVPFTATLELRSPRVHSRREGAPAIPEGFTLVRLSGVSSKDRALSWPLRVALEAVLQRTAGYLREAVEAEVAAESAAAQERSPSR